MASITQDLKFKQAAITYSLKYGVTKAATRYKKTRQWIYYWRKRYDGTPESLKEKSRRPHHHPNEHTEEELTLIKNMIRNNKNLGLVILWVKLRWRGYTRSISSLYRVLQRNGYYKEKKKKKPKRTSKPYKQMTYPGERIQIDVKFVPQDCTRAMGEGTKLYQFTAIDEYSRQRYLEGFSDNSSYSAATFMKHVIKYFKFKIKCVQTDNGQEFTKTFSSKYNKNGEYSPTLFQKVLIEHRIEHKLIRPFTPRHNGKVERSHRKDGERFYAKRTFYSLEDYNKQLRRYLNEYNNFPMEPLGWLSPNEYLANFYANGVTND